MSWTEHHESSERLASQAETAVRENRRDEALKLYADAACAEERAVEALDQSKTRTLGISVVSAAALHYKANQPARAEAVAVRWLGFDGLPAFARDQLRLLLLSIWSERQVAQFMVDQDEQPPAGPKRLRGVLRAVHLEEHWLELTEGSGRRRVVSVGKEVDDVIGPLVNRPVIVHTFVVDGKNRFLRIELDSTSPAASTVIG